ncbi:MAG: histidinol dehydrogenase, partial [Bacteroidota bacterium]|nr:histidinol dehydrogenase [Bacteroidota bacterium]
MELKVIRNPKPAEWENLLQRPAINLQSLETIVRNVLLAVMKDGDEALKKYTLEFDKVSLDKIEVSADEIEAASGRL